MYEDNTSATALPTKVMLIIMTSTLTVYMVSVMKLPELVILILHNLLGITFLSGMQDGYLFMRDPLSSPRDELCQKTSSQGSR